MPDTTDCVGLRFPLDTDRQNTARDIELLAEQIDNAICGASVDIDELKTAVNNRVKKAGDTMTGALIANSPGTAIDLRRSGDNPFIAWSAHPAAADRFGYIMAEGKAGMRYNADATSAYHRWVIGTTEVMRLSPGGQLQMDGSLTLGGAVYANAFGAFGGNGQQVRCVDTSGGSIETPSAYIGFFRSGTVQAPTNRGGYVGFLGNANLSLQNEIGGGHCVIACNQAANGTGGVYLRSGLAGDIIIDCGDDIIFQTNQVTRGVMNGDRFIWGKAASDFSVNGVEMIASGGSEGAIWSTLSGKGNANISLRKRGDASVDNEWFIHCLNNAGSSIGGIRGVGTTSALTAVELVGTATSDYRVKEEVGPIDDGLVRLLQLRPIRYMRTDHDDGKVYDGLIAHEVAEIVPQAVRGDKDATQADGTPDLQDMYGDRLVPLLIAAVQELNKVVAQLVIKVHELEENCCG